jgi:hypothetical protein
MAVSKDKVKPSPQPDSWKLAEIFATGVVLGAYLAMMTVIFSWVAYKTDFFLVWTSSVLSIIKVLGDPSVRSFILVNCHGCCFAATVPRPKPSEKWPARFPDACLCGVPSRQHDQSSPYLHDTLLQLVVCGASWVLASVRFLVA